MALQKYHWVEEIDHVHHAGNSSGIVDGSALVAIGTREAGERYGLQPRARILSAAVSGADPTIMLTGPAPASRKALAKAGLTADDMDLVEINEAFAAVVLRFAKDMGLPLEKVNVNGGAIAMGHPLGATGAMLLGTARRRTGAPRAALRAGHPVRRRRHGHRHRRRTALDCRAPGHASRSRSPRPARGPHARPHTQRPHHAHEKTP